MSSDSVKVALRIRPLTAKEQLNSNRVCVTVIPNCEPPQVVLQPDKRFSFDYIFDENSSQEDVYHDCIRPLLNRFIDGFNSTILAYGQTGSGKTYTMGTGMDGNINPDLQGICYNYI